VVLGALALSECGSRQGCLRGIPGSHKWGILPHEETDDPRSILARGQYITQPFDESAAVDFELRPGEMAMFHNSLVHGSAGNFGPDRRFLLLVEMLATWAKPAKIRRAISMASPVSTSLVASRQTSCCAEPISASMISTAFDHLLPRLHAVGREPSHREDQVVVGDHILWPGPAFTKRTPG